MFMSLLIQVLFSFLCQNHNVSYLASIIRRDLFKCVLITCVTYTFILLFVSLLASSGKLRGETFPQFRVGHSLFIPSHTAKRNRLTYTFNCKCYCDCVSNETIFPCLSLMSLQCMNNGRMNRHYELCECVEKSCLFPGISIL